MNKFRFWLYSTFKSNRRVFLEMKDSFPRGQLFKITDDARCKVLAFKKLKNGNINYCMELYSKKEIEAKIRRYEELLGN